MKTETRKQKKAEVADEQACGHCGMKCSVSREEIIYGPDPFACEIHNNETPMWICKYCYHQSCMDI